jgi:hypothetical protein
MADVQEDVTLLAHIRAEDEGASDVFMGIGNAVKGFGGAMIGIGADVVSVFSSAAAAVGALGGISVGVFDETVISATKYGEAVAKVAFLTGESSKQSSGLISAFRAQGFTTDEATASIQRLTSRLGNIDQQFRSTGKLSASSKEQLAELGLTTDDLVKHGGDLSAQLPKIIDNLKNMQDPLERDRLSMQLFGRNFGSIAPLIDAGGAAFARAEGDASRFGVSLSRDQVTALETYKSAIETTKEAIQGVSLQIAFYALPYFQKLQDLIKEGIKWWEGLSPSVHKTVLEVAKLVAIFGPLIGGAEAINKGIGFLVKNVPILGNAFEALLGPLVPFLGVIGPMVAAFIILQHLFETNAQAAKLLTPVIALAKSVFQEFMDVLDILRDVWNQIVSDQLPKGQASFANIAQSVRDFVYNALLQLSTWLLNAKQWIADHRVEIGLWADKLTGLAGDIGKFVSDVLQPFLASMGNMKDFILNDLIPALSQIAWPTVDPTVQSAWDWLKVNGKLVGQAIKDIAVGYLILKGAGTLFTAIDSVRQFAQAFQVVQAEEGTAIALQRTLGIEAVLNSIKATAAWIASGVKMVASAIASAASAAAAWVLGGETVDAAAVATGTEAEAEYAAMGMASEEGAAKSTAAWVSSSVKSAAAAVASAARSVAANTAAFATSTAGAVAMGARTVAAWALAGASAVAAAAKTLIFNGAMLVVRAATIAWTTVQWLLNVALSANPIGLIVVAIALLVAGVILAYQHSSVFRGIVNALWADLKGWAAWITGVLVPAVGRFFSWLGSTASGIVNGVGAAFSGLGTTVQNVWSGISGTVRRYVNEVIGIIDNFIRGVNRITIPSWVPVVGGQHSNIPQIPYLAEGAIVGPGFGGPGVAMIGEGNEAEIVAKMSQIFKAGMQAAGGAGTNQGTFVFEFHMDGKMIERRMSKITGQRMRLQGAGIGSNA